MTLSDAKASIFSNMNMGSKCPCCGQTVKLYRRALQSSMVMALIALHRAGPDWQHLPSLLSEKIVGPTTRGGDWSKLVFWGFIEPRPEKREDGSARAGWWRITDAGLAFVNGALSAPAAVYLYNQTFYGFDTRKQVTVEEALGKGFNYQELMAGKG